MTFNSKEFEIAVAQRPDLVIVKKGVESTIVDHHAHIEIGHSPLPQHRLSFHMPNAEYVLAPTEPIYPTDVNGLNDLLKGLPLAENQPASLFAYRPRLMQSSIDPAKHLHMGNLHPTEILGKRKIKVTFDSRLEGVDRRILKQSRISARAQHNMDFSADVWRWVYIRLFPTQWMAQQYLDQVNIAHNTSWREMISAAELQHLITHDPTWQNKPAKS